MYFIIFIVGFLSGAFVAVIVTRACSVGVLHVEQLYQQEKPYLFLELSNVVDDILTKQYITLHVRLNNHEKRISHK